MAERDCPKFFYSFSGNRTEKPNEKGENAIGPITESLEYSLYWAEGRPGRGEGWGKAGG